LKNIAENLRLYLVGQPDPELDLAAQALGQLSTSLAIIQIRSWETLVRALEQKCHLVITRDDLMSASAEQVLRKVRECYPGCPVILLSRRGGYEEAVEAMKMGFSDFVLKKDEDWSRLLTSVSSTLEKVRSDQRAARLEVRLQALLNRLNVGVFRTSMQGELLEANRSFLSMIGLAEIPVQPPLDLRDLHLRPSDFHDYLTQVTETGHVPAYEVQWKRKDGRALWVALTQTVTRTEDGLTVIEGILEDIGHRKELESQLRQSQKMESVGKLAAGLAHDFNNILTIIQGYSSFLLEEKVSPEESQEALKQICEATNKAAGLTRQLLTFSRKQLVQPRSINLNEVVENVLKLLQRMVGEDIGLECHFMPSLPSIMADPGMLEQVIMNLSVNARDAMSGGGKITIASTVVTIDPEVPRLNRESRPGRYACLRFTDTGCGMDQNTMAQIFEPFFTTKTSGKGTGLGLATVYGIVKQHRGWIEVSSKVGVGTTFQLFFPAEQISPPRENREHHFSLKGGNETILIVEDEKPLRKLVSDVLKSHGYVVHEAHSAMEALRTWASQIDKIDLLFTDMKTPEGLTGFQLAEALLARKPDLKVVYTTGYSLDLAQNKVNLDVGLNYLPKPYQPAQLVNTIRKCLDLRNKR